MASEAEVDVLIFEDIATETAKIIEWFGLRRERCRISPVFQTPPASATANKGWRMVQKEVVGANPRVVVMDHFLSGLAGDDPFQGSEFANQCKNEWPHLGVIVVTTGGDGELRGTIESQSKLDEQKDVHNWAVDYAWVKPWGSAGDSRAHRPVQKLVRELVEQSWRPSEH